MVIRGWVATLSTEHARVWGDFALTLFVMGTVIGSIHLAGIDGVALPAFGNVLRAPDAAPGLNVAAAALLKVHLTTFMAWAVVFWMAGQAAMSIAAFLDSRQPRALAVITALGGRTSSRVHPRHRPGWPADDPVGGRPLPAVHDSVHDLLPLDLFQPAKRVGWADLQKVEVVTTGDGPFAPDVVWVLHGTDAGCAVPQGATGDSQLLERLQALPGFDNHALIEAMSSTTDRRFLCWRRAT